MLKHKLIIRYWYETPDGLIFKTFYKPSQGVARGVYLEDCEYIDSIDCPQWDSLPEDIREGSYYCLIKK